MTQFVFNREVLNTLAEAIRSNDVASNNSATKWARYTLNSIRNDASVTYAVIEMATVTSFKVKGINGKQGTVGGLRKAGFAAMAKRLTDVKYIAEQMGVEGVAPLVDTFILSDKDKDSFNALNLAVREAVAKAGSVEADAVEPTQSDTDTDTDTDTDEAPATDTPMDVASVLASMAAYVNGLDVADIVANDVGLATLMEAISTAYNTAAAAVPMAEAA